MANEPDIKAGILRRQTVVMPIKIQREDSCPHKI
jgi:hypothetical protein